MKREFYGLQPLFILLVLGLLAACSDDVKSNPILPGDGSEESETDLIDTEDGAETADEGEENDTVIPADEDENADMDADILEEIETDDDADLDSEEEIEEEEAEPNCDGVQPRNCFPPDGVPGESGYICVGSQLVRYEHSFSAPPDCIPKCLNAGVEACAGECVDPGGGGAYCEEVPDEEWEDDFEEEEAEEILESEEESEIEADEADEFEDEETEEEAEELEIEREIDRDPDETTWVCPMDAFDANASNQYQSVASVIDPGEYTNLSICSGDIDWFAVDVEADKVVTVTVSYAYSFGDLSLVVRDDTHSVMLVGNTAEDFEEISYETVLASTTYIMVRGQGTGVENLYTLGVMVEDPPQPDEEEFEEELEEEEEEAEPEEDIMEIEEADLTPACLDDPYEPSSQDDPAALPSGALQDLVLCEEDTDYYAIELEERDEIKVEFTSELYGHIRICLIPVNPVQMRCFNQESFEGSVAYTVPVGEAGEHIVYVNHRSLWTNWRSPYSLNVQVTPYGGCTNDDYEPNNIPEEASVGVVETPLSLAFCPWDTDIFSYHLDQGEIIRADLTFQHADGNIDLRLTDTDGVELKRSDSISDNEVLVYKAESAGDYLLYAYVLSNYAASAVLYVEKGFEDICEEDGMEDNDSTVQAIPFEQGTVAMTICPDDEDWLSLDLADNEHIEAYIRFDVGEEAMITHFLDSSLFAVQNPISMEGGVYFDKVVSSGGRYYLKFAPPPITPREVAYSVEVKRCREDIYEDNDSSYRATIAPLGTTSDLYICPEDEDWFAIPISSDDWGGELPRLTIYVTFVHQLGDLDIYLYDGYGHVILSSTSRSNNEHILYDVENFAYYYLRVVGANGNVGNRYDLELWLSEQP